MMGGTLFLGQNHVNTNVHTQKPAILLPFREVELLAFITILRIWQAISRQSLKH